MDEAVEASYQPPAGYVENDKDSLIDFELKDSTELWLIQWPVNQHPDFNGQRMSLKLKSDGQIGTLEESSGKSYDAVSLKAQGPEATVFLSSASDTKIAGKISRCVSLIHYPDPSEVPKRNLNFSRSSMASSSRSGHHSSATPSRSNRPRHSQALSGYSTPSSRTKSTVSGMGEPSKSTKRKRPDDERRSSGHSALDSGRGNSGVTSTGSVEKSHKKKKKH